MGTGLGFAVAAALLYGTYLYVYKRYFSHLPAMAYLAVAEGAAALWYLPVALDAWSADLAVSALDAGAVVVTALLTGVAIALSIRAIQLGDVSYVTPLNKLVPLFVLPMELLLLETVLAPLQIAGVLVATAGIYLANYEAGGLLAPFRRALSYRPAQLALVGAAVFAVVDLLKRVLLQELSLPVPLVVWVSLVGITAVVAPFGWRQRGDLPRRVLPKLLALGVVLALGDHLIALAFARLPASVASPVVNAQAVVAVLLGGLLLREAAFSRRLAASLLVVGGIALLALG
ncbi:DMT family transporter [Halomarina litorea]|uniref:DMT family transporter n=1 Tax=Halomarina litorea TaxID=2961595 RepID=UPI0034A39AB7